MSHGEEYPNDSESPAFTEGNGKDYSTVFEIKQYQRRFGNCDALISKYEAENSHNENGRHWAVLGHCYYVTNDLHKCYQAYQ